MKRLHLIILLAVALLSEGCEPRQTASVAADSLVSVNASPFQTSVRPNWEDSVELYRQQARAGSSEAYLKLAHCYHEGRGVKRDFLTMQGHDPDSIPIVIYNGLEKESSFLEQCIASIGAIDAGHYHYAATHLKQQAESSPALWLSLGNLYAYQRPVHSDSLAAIYYAKADSCALLGQREHRWLDDYRARNNRHLEVER